MENEQFLKQLKQHENQWVALLESEMRIVGSGNDASEARRDAEKEGFRDVILMRVLPFRGAYVPTA